MSIVKFVIPDFPNNFVFHDNWPDKKKRVVIERDKLHGSDLYRIFVVIDLRDGKFNGLKYDEEAEMWLNIGSDILFKTVLPQSGAQTWHKTNRWISDGRIASHYELESLRIDAVPDCPVTIPKPVEPAPESDLIPIEVRTVEKYFFLGSEYATELDAKRARARTMLKNTFKFDTIETIIKYRDIVNKALRSME